MSHLAQREFCRSVKTLYPKYFKDVSVLDVGSLDINGNNRYLFENFSYTGIDIVPGRNVNTVTAVHEFEPKLIFDVVISTEMLEHDKHWKESLKRMYDLTRHLLLITCAAPGREEHGTTRSKPKDSPGTNDYYKNISVQMFMEVLKPEMFKTYEIKQIDTDLQFYGIK